MSRQTSLDETAIDGLMNRLLTEDAPEWGARQGMLGLQDRFMPFAAAEVRRHLTKRSLQPSAEVLRDQIQTLRDQQDDFRRGVEAYRAKYGAPEATPARSAEAKAYDWKAAASVAMATALIALFAGASLKGWVMLGVAALVVIVNLEVLPVWWRRWKVRSRDYLEYRRAVSGFARCEKQIRQGRARLLSSKEQENLIERQAELAENVLRSCVGMYEELGKRAAKQITQQQPAQ